jgi:proteic killer suppression protein
VKTKVTYARLFEKQIEKVPLHIKERVRGWLFTLLEEGVDEARKLKTYRDEALRGNRKGQRSIRLNRAYRLIYEIKDENIHIHILEVNKHEY